MRDETRSISLEMLPRMGDITLIAAEVPARVRTPFARIRYRVGDKTQISPFDLDKRVFIDGSIDESVRERLDSAGQGIVEAVGKKVTSGPTRKPRESANAERDNEFAAQLENAKGKTRGRKKGAA